MLTSIPTHSVPCELNERGHSGMRMHNMITGILFKVQLNQMQKELVQLVFLIFFL